MDASCTSLIAPGLVDSPLKLQLLLLFYRHPRWCGDAWRLSEWIHESPWHIEDAVKDLAAANLLLCTELHGRAHYQLRAGLEQWAALVQLVICYDDPLRRDEIYTRVREAGNEQQFRMVGVNAPSSPFEVW